MSKVIYPRDIDEKIGFFIAVDNDVIRREGVNYFVTNGVVSLFYSFVSKFGLI